MYYFRLQKRRERKEKDQIAWGLGQFSGKPLMSIYCVFLTTLKIKRKSLRVILTCYLAFALEWCYNNS